MSDRGPQDPRHAGVRLESDVLPGKALAAAGIAVVAVTLLLVGLAALLLGTFEGSAGAVPAPAPEVAPDRLEGVLQTPLPGDRGLLLLREQAASLDRWGWSDREGGLVRLPLDVALERLLAGMSPDGLPFSDATPPPPPPDAGTDPRGRTGRDRGGREDAPAGTLPGAPPSPEAGAAPPGGTRRDRDRGSTP